VISRALRAIGVLAGLVGVALFSFGAFGLVSWLRGPMDDTDKVIVLVSFGAAIPFAWIGAALSLLFAGLSLHVVIDALGPCRGLSSGRLFIVAGLTTVVGLIAAVDGSLDRGDSLLFVSGGAISLLNLAFVIGCARVRKAP